jgi:hypothetical protein
VKQVIICILLPLFLLNGSLNEVFKLPVLFTHFTEHCQQDPELGLMDFISMHYWGDDHNDQDEDRDNQLPFKKTADHSSFQIAIFPPVKPVPEERLLFPGKSSVPVPQDAHLPNRTPDSLFRPPQA